MKLNAFFLILGLSWVVHGLTLLGSGKEKIEVDSQARYGNAGLSSVMEARRLMDQSGESTGFAASESLAESASEVHAHWMADEGWIKTTLSELRPGHSQPHERSLLDNSETEILSLENDMSEIAQFYEGHGNGVEEKGLLDLVTNLNPKRNLLK